MTPPCLAELHRGLLLLTLGLNVAGLGQARLLYQFQQLALILGRMEAAIERRTSDSAVQSLLRLCHLLHQNIAVFRPTRQDRIVADEARAILDYQDAVAELERLRNLATDDQLSVRLEQTEEFFAVVDPFSLEYSPSSQVTDMNGHIDVVGQFLPEHVDSGGGGTGSNGDQSGVEQVQRSGQNSIGQVQEPPVAVLKPLGKVAPFALGDLVDRAKLLLHGLKQMLALTPTAEAEESRQSHRQRYDRA